MAGVVLENIKKNFDGFTAVNNFTLEIKDGEFVTLLGPSGCGKTTTLRMIAGFIEPTEGSVSIGERIVSNPAGHIFVPPEERNIGMVFQTYAVWPHMNILDNVAYPLKIRKIARRNRYKKAEQVLELVQLGGMGKRYPHQLSGGQQQRVALARALIMDPHVMLLDEPLSNLDAKLREQMRFEIKELQKRTGVTIIYVTHDQAEAMAMSDRIVVMNRGEIQQIGKTEEIYEKPANKFVADFIGLINFIPCRVSRDRRSLFIRGAGNVEIEYPVPEELGDDVLLSVRPEDIDLQEYSRKNLVGTVTRVTYFGNIVDYLIRAGDVPIRVQLKEKEFTEGDRVSVIFDCKKFLFY